MSNIAGKRRGIDDELDAVFMQRAFELARRGRGATSPNPVVGAVLVKDGQSVGEGYHERFGGAHAEVNALAEAGDSAVGSTLYVTLEPCSVSGKTPPCTSAILSAGISRVVVPIEDSNPDVSGKGLSILREAGVEVDFGLMHDEARELNAPYFKYRRTGLPFTTLKLALSLDGRIAPPPGGPRWTSSPESRRLVHSMRTQTDCVMVGIGTVLADDPRLTARGPDDTEPASGRQPARLVLDTHLRVPADSHVVSSAGEFRTVVACGSGADPSKLDALERVGVTVWPCDMSEGRLDLRGVLRRAAEHGMISVLSEGGGKVATSLLESGLADRVAFFLAPRLYGADGTPALSSLGEEWSVRRPEFKGGTWTPVGDDCLYEADLALDERDAGRED